MGVPYVGKLISGRLDGSPTFQVLTESGEKMTLSLDKGRFNTYPGNLHKILGNQNLDSTFFVIWTPDRLSNFGFVAELRSWVTQGLSAVGGVTGTGASAMLAQIPALKNMPSGPDRTPEEIHFYVRSVWEKKIGPSGKPIKPAAKPAKKKKPTNIPIDPPERPQIMSLSLPDPISRNNNYIRIGDVILKIPPQQIAVSDTSAAERRQLIRNRTSIKKKLGHKRSIININMIFSGIEDLNGYSLITDGNTPRPYKEDGVKLITTSGKHKDEYLSIVQTGLRPLITLFQKAPFCPIINTFINDSLATQSVAIQSIACRTIEGFPWAVEVDLGLLDFNHKGYIYDAEFFDHTINYPLFQKYVQYGTLDPMVDSEDRIRKAPRLKKIEEGNNLSDISFSVANEDSLKALVKGAITAEDIERGTIEAVGLWEGFLAPLADIINNEYAEVLDRDEQKGFTTATKERKLFKDWFKDPLNALRKGIFAELKVRAEKRGLNADLISIEPHSKANPNVYLSWSYGQLRYTPSYTIDFQIRREYTSPGCHIGANIGSNSPYYKVFEENCQSILKKISYEQTSLAGNQAVYNINITEAKASNYWITPIDLIRGRDGKFQSSGANKLENLYKQQKAGIQPGRAPRPEGAEALEAEERILMEPWPIVGMAVPMQIEIGAENYLTPLQIQAQDSPIYQYLGSSDINIRVTFHCDSDGVGSLRSLKDRTDYLARHYRWAVVVSNIGGKKHEGVECLEGGFINVYNELMSLFGVHSVFLDSIDAQSQPGFPNSFMVTLTMSSFDRTQKKQEEFTRWSNQTYNILSSPVGKTFHTYLDFYNQLHTVELYPDLDLPTKALVNKWIKELELYDWCEPYNHVDMEHSFVDPDFYFNTTLTNGDFVKEFINIEKDNKEAYEETIYDSLDNSGAGYPTVNFDGSENGKAIHRTPVDESTMQPKMSSSIKIDKKVLDDIGRLGPTKWAEMITKPPALRHPLDPEWRRPSDEWLREALKQGKISPELINKLVPPAEKEKKPTKRTTISETMRVLKDNTTSIIKSLDLNDDDWILIGDSTDLNDPRMSKRKKAILDDLVLLDASIFEHPLEQSYLPWGPQSSLGWGYLLVMPDPPWWNPFYEILVLKRIAEEGLTDEDIKSGYRLRRVIRVDKLKRLPSKEGVKDLWDKGTLQNAREEFWGTSKTGGQGFWEWLITNYPSVIGAPGQPPGQIIPTTQIGIPPLLASPKTSPWYGSAPIPDWTFDRIKKEMFHDYTRNSAHNRMLRAFPTFLLCIIDEGRIIGLSKINDWFYGYNAIQEIHVTKSRKSATDLCLITISNLFGNMMSESHGSEGPEEDEGSSGWWTVIKDVFHPEATKETLRKWYESHLRGALKLRAGSRIHLRLGFGGDATFLPVVFNGAIAEVPAGSQAGGDVTLVAQGDGRELQGFISAKKNDLAGGMLKYIEPQNLIVSLLAHRGWFSPFHTLSSIMGTLTHSVAGNFFARMQTESPWGVEHFGNPNFGWVWPWDKGGECAQNVYRGMIDSGQQLGKYADEDDFRSRASPWEIPRSLDSILDTVGSFSFPESGAQFSFYLGNKTIWDMIQLCALSIPDYIAVVHPFEFRSTLFYGKPYYPMAYGYDHAKMDELWDKSKAKWVDRQVDPKDVPGFKDLEDAARRRLEIEFEASKTAGGLIKVVDQIKGVNREDLELVKPFQQAHILTSFTDIIHNEITATAEDMFTVVEGSYYLNNITHFIKTLLHADPPIKEGSPNTATLPVFADFSINPEWKRKAVIDAEIFFSPWVATGKVFTEFGNTRANVANNVATSVLRDFLKDMYQGSLIVMGDATIKPIDLVYIADTYEWLGGVAEVKTVTHHMSFDTGFITDITPDCCVYIADNKIADIYRYVHLMGMATTFTIARFLSAPSFKWLVRLKIDSRAKIFKYFLGNADPRKGKLTTLINEVNTQKTPAKMRELNKLVDELAEDKVFIKNFRSGIRNQIRTGKMDPALKRLLKSNGLDVDKVYKALAKRGPISTLRGIVTTLRAMESRGMMEELSISARLALHNLYDRPTREVLREYLEYGGLLDTWKAVGKKLGSATQWIRATGSGLYSRATSLSRVGKAFKVAGFFARTAVGILPKFIRALPAGLNLGKMAYTFGLWTIPMVYGNLVSRWMRNLQAVVVFPLKKHGKEFSAGISGHQGMCSGDQIAGWKSTLTKAHNSVVANLLLGIFGIMPPDYNPGANIPSLSPLDLITTDDSEVAVKFFRGKQVPGQAAGASRRAESTSLGRGSEQWRGLVSKYFPDYAVNAALRVIQAESTGNRFAEGDEDTAYHSIGLFQIRMLPGRPTRKQLEDAEFNIKYAANLWNSSNRRWSKHWTNTARKLGLE